MSRTVRSRTTLWIYRVMILTLLVTNAGNIVSVFLKGGHYPKVIHGYSLFSMPDGTAGVVMAGGTITYTPDFSRVYREYSITKGGFFRIEHGYKLFVLHCEGGLIIRSHGGAFEVGPVPGNENKMRVLVGRECVEITDLAGNWYGYVHEKEEATIDVATKRVTRKRYDNVFVSDRNVRPVLRFERMSIADVAAQLEHVFDVDIRVDTSVGHYLVDATFPENIGLVDALKMLEAINRDHGVVCKIVKSRNGEIEYVSIHRKNTVSTK